MVRHFSYALWNGKEVLGHYHSMMPIRSRSITIPTVSIWNEKYNVKRRTEFFHMTVRLIQDDGVRVVHERVIDVRRKSKRQINLLKGGQHI